jgi:hypothetical protein
VSDPPRRLAEVEHTYLHQQEARTLIQPPLDLRLARHGAILLLFDFGPIGVLRLPGILSLGTSGLRGDIVTGFVDSSIARYAVIEARRTEGRSERFVIVYSDEESLRELIAGP